MSQRPTPSLAALGMANLSSVTPPLMKMSLILAITSLLCRIVYNLFFHPLAKYPGPRLRAASTIPFMYALVIGQHHEVVVNMHKEYGTVVRIAPNKLSYITGQAWQDINGHRKRTEPEMPRDDKWFTRNPNGPDMVYCSREEHRRYRGLFAGGFSDRSLRSQEPLIGGYVTSLINNLARRVKERKDTVFDLVTWFECTTFDVVGDLTFGESFGCLETGEVHPWLRSMSDTAKAFQVIRACQEIPLIGQYSTTVLPRIFRVGVIKKSQEHFAFTEGKLRRRLDRKEPRADFLGPILQKPDGKGLSYPELLTHSSILILAGGDTVTGACAAIVYLLLQNPDKMEILVNEVLTTFQHEDMITIDSTSRLVYLRAVIKEGLRHYPPVPIGIPRTVPEGGSMIDKEFVPEGTSVCVSHMAAYQSTLNFERPDEFCPERFLDTTMFSDKLDVYQPFSLGPRNCIGRNLAYAEMQMILTRLLYRFDLRLQDDKFAFGSQRTFTGWERPPLNVSLIAR
ncbi:uncharacterized protein N7482_006400 [Penicillium canariense]|uniref:Cytochrome P450 n=1 Tax=Penicillium canariense TaxID=189055 RepID=A0A9W9HXG9_9EURO|nr:uncharacterized protein N7482_006400 [Penicillium canariense]KAJ5159396.1 hypothetical protein N7482_006400 [Penicillium canariense]